MILKKMCQSWRLILNCVLLLMIMLSCVYFAALFYQKKYKSYTTDSDLATIYYIALDNMSKQIRNNGKCINNILCYSEKDDTLNISSVINDRDLVILYGGDNYCNSCIDYHMHAINGLVSYIGKENIIILYKNISARELSIIRSNNKLEVPVYATNDSLSIYLEEDGQPCYFILNKNLNISNTFYPIKGQAKFNKVFYDFLIEKYEKKLSK